MRLFIESTPMPFMESAQALIASGLALPSDEIAMRFSGSVCEIQRGRVGDAVRNAAGRPPMRVAGGAETHPTAARFSKDKPGGVGGHRPGQKRKLIMMTTQALHDRYRRINAAYEQFLGRPIGEVDPADVDFDGAVSAIGAAVPGAELGEIIAALRWAAEQNFAEAEADALQRYGEQRGFKLRE